MIKIKPSLLQQTRIPNRNIYISVQIENDRHTLPVQSPYDENNLAYRLATGDENAFEQVYKKHWNRIYSIALVYLKSRQLAEDAVQEVFLKLWSKRQQLTNVKNLEGFIFIIARNHVIDTLKKVMAIRFSSTEAEDWLPDDLLLPAAQVELKSLQKKISDAIEMLPPQQKNVIKMSREEGLTHEQIGERLGIDRKTVKNHIVRALATLRRLLRDGEALLLFLFL